MYIYTEAESFTMGNDHSTSKENYLFVIFSQNTYLF